MAKNCPPDQSLPQDECGNDPFASTPTESPPPSPLEPQKEEQPSTSGESPMPSVGAMPYYLAAFGAITGAGIGFLSVLLYATADIQFMAALWKVCRRLLKTVALRQLLGVVGAMLFIRFGLEPLVKFSRKLFNTKGTWETSTERDILRDVYQPLEFLFFTAALTTLVENFLPQLMALPKVMVQTFVRSTLSLTFVLTAAKVVFNIKGRMIQKGEFDATLTPQDAAKQRRLEALDKLLSVLTLLVGTVFGLQAIGLDVNSVLAIGGVGGLAVGLAGREILENLFTGLIILSSRPFDVGDEVLFTPPNGPAVEGFVLDVGWYRTTIRSFEREIYNIPNSVFSRNVVLNITRKENQWRFFEFVGVRVEDVDKLEAMIKDMRLFMTKYDKVIGQLHKRVFLDKVTRDQVSIYMSCYLSAPNRDAFMNYKQELFLGLLSVIKAHGAKLARNYLNVGINSEETSREDALRAFERMFQSSSGVIDVPLLPAQGTNKGKPAGPSFSKSSMDDSFNARDVYPQRATPSETAPPKVSPVSQPGVAPQPASPLQPPPGSSSSAPTSREPRTSPVAASMGPSWDFSHGPSVPSIERPPPGYILARGLNGDESATGAANRVSGGEVVPAEWSSPGPSYYSSGRIGGDSSWFDLENDGPDEGVASHAEARTEAASQVAGRTPNGSAQLPQEDMSDSEDEAASDGELRHADGNLGIELVGPGLAPTRNSGREVPGHLAHRPYTEGAVPRRPGPRASTWEGGGKDDAAVRHGEGYTAGEPRRAASPPLMEENELCPSDGMGREMALKPPLRVRGAVIDPIVAQAHVGPSAGSDDDN